MQISETTVLWSGLTPSQKEQGIHPAELGSIQFNFGESELSSDQSRQLHRFLVGCRMAASDSDFLSKSFKHLNSKEPIKSIVQRVLFTQMPKESKFQKDNHGLYPISFIGEGFGTTLCEYKAKFEAFYNQLVDEEKCFLAHPARRSELIAYLGCAFSNAELAADRLIAYRCFGYYGLKISELERTIQEELNERQQVERKLKALSESAPNLIVHPEELQEESLTCIPDELCRKHVCLAYKHLASQGMLEILNLQEKELYKYKGGSKGKVHPGLASCAKAYYDERPNLNFGMVVKYLITLSNNDLNSLMKYCLMEERERLTWLINHYKNDELPRAKINYTNQLGLLEKSSENYKPGDFSFLSDPQTASMLTHAYQAVDKLQAWPFFDKEPPKDRGYTFWSHPMLSKIGNELDSDGHSGASMAFAMRWMQRIRKQGWNVAVRESLESNSETMGVLNRAQALKQANTSHI
jgi:hypothetical protein